MNNSSEIFSTHESNFSDFFFSNGTNMETDFEMSSVGYIICILLGLSTNSYVIWLIVTGTGNGLAAEIFILDLSVCEILMCIQNLLFIISFYFQISWIGFGFLDGVMSTGHSLFQCLICVERYLAVVHPVTFLKYKPLRYRVICSVIAWVATFVSGSLSAMICSFSLRCYFIFWMTQFFLYLFVQLFCCVAVLRALKQSGPGERGREREEENHMKRRAFYLILITTVTTVFIYATFFCLLFILSDKVYAISVCISQLCFTVAGLVQPVLFLYRVGKLNIIKCR